MGGRVADGAKMLTPRPGPSTVRNHPRTYRSRCNAALHAAQAHHDGLGARPCDGYAAAACQAVVVQRLDQSAAATVLSLRTRPRQAAGRGPRAWLMSVTASSADIQGAGIASALASARKDVCGAAAAPGTSCRACACTIDALNARCAGSEVRFRAALCARNSSLFAC